MGKIFIVILRKRIFYNYQKFLLLFCPLFLSLLPQKDSVFCTYFCWLIFYVVQLCLPFFMVFYQKSFKERNAMISILIGLFLGLLLFPNPDFSKSILVGILLPFDLFPHSHIYLFIILVIFSSNTWTSNCYNKL